MEQCALVSLLHLLERHKCKQYQVVAIDLVEARRQKAQSIIKMIGPGDGAVQCANPDEAKLLVKEWTAGVGCSAVIEVSPFSVMENRADV